MDIVIILLLIIGVIFIWHKYHNLVQAHGNLQEAECEAANVRSQLDRLYDQEREIKEQLLTSQQIIEDGNKKVLDIQMEIIGLQSARDALDSTLDTTRGQVQNQLNLLQEYESIYLTTQQIQDERCKKAEEEANSRIQLIEEECTRLMGEKRLETQRTIESYTADAEQERLKYLSIVETIANAQSDAERDLNRHIKVRESAQDDIEYLLNNVVKHLTNPDILYKLIWSEFIQKPTNEMLDYVLPQKDCPGIYKITNDRNKKSYIGRSTSVRKRLADHIKSAIGISTIANQKIHEIMREEGIWNFTFELIEECDKDKLSEREKYYIDFFQTADTTYGYNQKAGG